MTAHEDQPAKLTSRTIAELAGVSQTTVSRVLQGHPYVTAPTRAKVQRVVETTGYSPNAAARSLRTSLSGILGVVVERMDITFYPELAEALHREVTRQGHQMSLWISDGQR
jgi:LacI family transcriptional regulator